jgi:SAM-dependent methyltransferase
LKLEDWNQRYRDGEYLVDRPAPLLERFALPLEPGRALDLACGPGRHALYLAARGWHVTAVDGSPIAIDILSARAGERRLEIDARVADLERNQFQITPCAFDLICDCYYLQRDLFGPIQSGVRPGGLAIVIVLLADAGSSSGNAHRAADGEIARSFAGWKILHSYEGKSDQSDHSHRIAELVARKPG